MTQGLIALKLQKVSGFELSPAYTGLFTGLSTFQPTLTRLI